MADKSKLEELVSEKRAAGLTRDQAEEAAKRQIAWDEKLAEEEAKAEKAKKKGAGKETAASGNKPEGETK